MPRVSQFFGIDIYVYWRDHDPPHFHAYHAEYEACISLDDLRVLRGSLPPRVLGLVMEWAALRQTELKETWRRATNLEAMGRIRPLS